MSKMANKTIMLKEKMKKEEEEKLTLEPKKPKVIRESVFTKKVKEPSPPRIVGKLEITDPFKAEEEERERREKEQIQANQLANKGLNPFEKGSKPETHIEEGMSEPKPLNLNGRAPFVTIEKPKVPDLPPPKPLDKKENVFVREEKPKTSESEIVPKPLGKTENIFKKEKHESTDDQVSVTKPLDSKFQTPFARGEVKDDQRIIAPGKLPKGDLGTVSTEPSEFKQDQKVPDSSLQTEKQSENSNTVKAKTTSPQKEAFVQKPLLGRNSPFQTKPREETQTLENNDYTQSNPKPQLKLKESPFVQQDVKKSESGQAEHEIKPKALEKKEHVFEQKKKEVDHSSPEESNPPPKQLKLRESPFKPAENDQHSKPSELNVPKPLANKGASPFKPKEEPVEDLSELDKELEEMMRERDAARTDPSAFKDFKDYSQHIGNYILEKETTKATAVAVPTEVSYG